MKFKYLLILSTILFHLTSCNLIPEKWPEDGVSYPLAKERADRVQKLEYNLKMDIPANSVESIIAQSIIQFSLMDKSDDLFLDFKADSAQVHQIIINNDTLIPRIVNEHIKLPKASLEKENKVVIDFTMGDGPLNRNKNYFYSLFVPDRARTAIPCFDQPDIKGTFAVTMTLPQNWEGITNGPQVMTQALSNHRKTIEFLKSKPISTYLWAFAAGEFNHVTTTWHGKTIGLYHMVKDTSKVNRNLPIIFSQTIKSLDWLENYTNYDYPYEHYNLVAIPSFQFGGMEHPGATYYRSDRIFLDENPTKNDEISRANVIAHETAHMWFGDLVTMKWFEEVWLKEVFANFMADKITQPWFADINHKLQFLLAHFPSAYAVDRTEGTNSINQKLHNLKNAGTLYGNIIYHKSPIVMAQLESMVGPEKLQTGIQEYIHNFAFGNATWDDLIACIDKLTENDLTVWSNNWVNKPGRPIITMIPPNDDNDSWTLKQFPEHPQLNTPSTYWPQQVSSIINNTETKLDYFDAVMPINKGIAYPNTLFFSDDKGYGLFRMNGQQISYWLKHTSDIEDPLLRGRSTINLFENFWDGSIRPNQYINFLLQNIDKETEPLLVNLYANQLKNVFWNTIHQDSWPKVSKNIANTIINKAQTSNNLAIKKTLFSLWIDVALDTESYEQMALLCNQSNLFYGVSLSDKNRIHLISQLAIRNYKGWQILYNQVINQISNNDLKEMMIFSLPALSNSTRERDLFWASLSKKENRTKESWVQQSLSYLHHPLRQKHSINYLLQTLNMLEEIQLTGDIFFPSGWLKNSIGLYSSQEAKNIVDQYLANHPQYPNHLKNKILQNIDKAQRCVTISKLNDDLATQNRH